MGIFKEYLIGVLLGGMYVGTMGMRGVVPETIGGTRLRHRGGGTLLHGYRKPAQTHEAFGRYLSCLRKVPSTVRWSYPILQSGPIKARNVKKLKGRDGYRLRVGDWRVVYDIHNGELVLLVIEIGPRGSIYD